jgi:hypothetical protein
LGRSCFGASDHGPVSFRRVGQSVDLPAKARRWGHDLRGSRQSGCLKPWSRPPQPRRTPSLASGVCMLCARRGRRPGWSGAETGAQARPGGGPRAVSGASRLEPVEKVVTQSVVWGVKSYAQSGRLAPWRCAIGRKTTGRIVHVMRVLAWVRETVQASMRKRARRVSMRPS